MKKNIKKDIQQLYILMDDYLLHKISASTFCDKFYALYDLELDHKALNERELFFFSRLSEVAGRFSQYEEDHELDAQAFSTEQELKDEILNVKENL